MKLEEILQRHARALEARRPWEGVWRECYEHVLATVPGTGGPALFDGTRRMRWSSWRPPSWRS